MSFVLPLIATEQAGCQRRNPTGSLLDALLREQQRTAVEKFSQWHDRDAPPLQARYYSELLPQTRPRPGEQYAFEVDLDACSGCKACVVACHNLNGLDEGETWRSVGLLHGGGSDAPVLQHVTTACHHCVEPACLDGCPVEAYEKDLLTGIVRHLDDQCIGCQYCILKCPYDVPKYNASKGIVRKCDMCTGRLEVGEAPACVQSCPNQAIRIAVVSPEAAIENAEANLFLPGAPEPGYTLPTTIYKSRRPMPANLLPADYFAARPQHAHWPLIWMLVLTQFSVGAFAVDQLLQLSLAANAGTGGGLGRALHLAMSFALGMLGLAASTLHLGRPWLAYRAVIGWRKSWLSREVLAFAAFAALASGYAILPWLGAWGPSLTLPQEQLLGLAVAGSGLIGVFCSTMIYVSTRRAFWNPVATGLKFVLTATILGSALQLAVWLGAEFSSPAGKEYATNTVLLLTGLLTGATILKLCAELSILAWLRSPTHAPLKRTAILLTGALARVTTARLLCALLGGVTLPGMLYLLYSQPSPPNALLAVAGSSGALALSLLGELLERYLFFAAVVAPKMPGAPAT